MVHDRQSVAEPWSAGAQESQRMRDYDIECFWNPVCPFAWITSRWITKVSAQTGYRVDWRFISLRLLNKEKDHATQFPPHYERGHGLAKRSLGTFPLDNPGH